MSNYVCYNGYTATPQIGMFVYILYYTMLPSVLWHLVGRQEGHPAFKKMEEGWWRWALVSPDGVAPTQMVLIFPGTIKSRSSLLAPAHPGGPKKMAIKWLWLYYTMLTRHW